ncbi:MAG: cupin domain-containing protein [Solirubrobacteraceae bacterium]|nr:cupin domain-containing protein [Solirubrobacteraceae bacterium]
MRVSNLDDVEPFTTLDGSQIRELAGRVSMPAVNQSFAEAMVPPGGATTEHYHRITEELYYFTAGRGRLRVDGQERDVNVGDCVLLPPGAVHKLWNTGDEPLRLLCCCAPAYTHEDTILTEEEPTG